MRLFHLEITAINSQYILELVPNDFKLLATLLSQSHLTKEMKQGARWYKPEPQTIRKGIFRNSLLDRAYTTAPDLYNAYTTCQDAIATIWYLSIKLSQGKTLFGTEEILPGILIRESSEEELALCLFEWK